MIPEGATDNGDGTFTAGTIVYDGTAHEVVVSNSGLVICEVNSNAHFIGLEQATKIDVARTIIEYCISAISS